MTELERLEINIPIIEDRIKSMRESYESGKHFGNRSDLLCDITMTNIRLEEDKQTLKELKNERKL